MTTTPESNQEPPIDPRLLMLLEGLRPTPPRDPEAAAQGRVRFLAELNALDLPEKTHQPWTRRWLAWLPGSPTSKENISMNTPKQRFAFSTLVILLAALIFLFGGASVTAYASQSALPGDTLYPFKTTLEQTRVALAGDAADQAELHLAFAQRRLDEIQRLIAGQRFDDIPAATQEFEAYVQQAAGALQVVAAGDPVRAASLANKISDALSRYAQTLSGMLAKIPETVKPEVEQAIQASITAENNSKASGEIEFTGRLEEMTSRAWTVAGRTVAITPQTEVKGTFQVGDMVKVHAFMADSILTAREIETAPPTVTGDDNTNDNASGNGNENEAGNANVEDNGNSNSDDRGEDNSNSGGNGNTSNENSNEQGDDNGNDQGNTNSDDGNDNTGQSGSGSEVRFSGSVQAMEGGQWTIGGRQVQVTSRTELRGQIRLGDTVEVRTVKDSSGNLVAYRIELVSSSGSQDNSNANSDDSSNTNSSNSNSSGSGGMDDDSNSNSDTNANTNDDHGGNSGGGGGSGGGNDNGGSDDNGTSGGDDSGGSDDNSNSGG